MLTQESRYFSPLKVYDEHLRIVDYLVDVLSKYQGTLVCPFASHCFFALPLAAHNKVRLNFINTDYYNFWLLYKNKPSVLHKLRDVLGPRQDENLDNWYKIIEKTYYSEQNPLIKAAAIMFMSRTNSNFNIFGGPYNIDFHDSFNDNFNSNILASNSKNVILSYQTGLSYDFDMFVQHVPNELDEAYEEMFGEKQPLEVFQKMKNCVLVSQNETLNKQYDCSKAIDFGDIKLLIRSDYESR